MSDEKIYGREFVMEESYLSPKGNLRLSKFLALVQEVVLGGSDFVGVGVEKVKEKNLYWVVMSYRFEIARMPRLGEKIFFQTYPGKSRSFIYPRYFIISDEAKHVIMRGISMWALLDHVTHRPVTPEVSGFYGNYIYSFPEELAWPPTMRLGDLTLKESRPVYPSDIDFNGHMSNIRYMDFALDSEALDFFDTHKIKAFQINYSSETTVGAKMNIYSSVQAPLLSYQGRVNDKTVFSLQIELDNAAK
jgi:Acyl-ACP thioesterase